MKTITLENGKKVDISDESYKALAESIIKPDKNWRADEGGLYWYVEDDGFITQDEDNHSKFGTYRHITGNYFRTEEEAEAYKERQLAIGTITRAINEANGDWEPDWKDEDQRKWMIFYEYTDELFGFSNTWSYPRPLIIPYCKDSWVPKSIIKNYEDDLKIIFGIE